MTWGVTPMGMTKLFAVFALAILFVGCASVGTEMNVAQMQQIEKGVTTRSDLVAQFGAPMSIGLDAEGRATAMWYANQVRSSARNFIPVYGMLRQEMNMDMQQLVVIFDDADVVESFTFNDSAMPVKSGVL